ncbi:hypothetical protein GCM10010260_10870 [Streptomyces filipinensis]|uniref:EF-hand domain-containing protein n=1 Tax=Streptomyces filipinensis TaxID=66887 RepID=A0A918M9P3_9ACTN|nr:EF-hand domain-containing protein [Streptomyces filipinensis]GGU80451.1 hypothetical protein GCM10010260_10870 [Streptomyces filipinensis]
MRRTTVEAATVARGRIFAMMDADGDGVVSAHDYLSRVDRTVQATGRSEDDPLVVAARGQAHKAWGAMDANGDGKLTFEEYDAWVGADKFDHICRFPLGSLFDLADGDGLVVRDEYLASIRSYVIGDASPMGEVLYQAPSDGSGGPV